MKPVARMRTIAQAFVRPRGVAAPLGHGLLLAAAAVFLGGTSARAQMPPAAGNFSAGAPGGAPQASPPYGPQLPPRSYMNKNVFYLPVLIDDRVRGQLREILLFAKDDPMKPWMLSKKSHPWEKVFPFQPNREGEFWFTVVTVDKSGRQMPADLTHEGPNLIVVFDCTPPQVDVRPVGSTPEGLCVQCDARDPNLDMTKTRFEYQTGDRVLRAGEAVAGRQNVFCIPAQANHNGMVRVSATDRANNTTTREINVSGIAAGGLTPTPPAVMQQLPNSPLAVQPVVQQSMVQPKPAAQQGCGSACGPILGSCGSSVASVRGGATETVKPSVSQMVPRSLPAQVAGMDTGPELIQQVKASVPASVPAPVRGTAAMPPVRQLVNGTHVSLEYQLDQAGASAGVGKVEVWVTADQGQSWQRLGEDPDRHSPVEIDLPAEGLFGVSLVVANARGFGDAPPKPGDVPDYWIEVDTTKPTVKLHSVRPGTEDEPGVLWISWTAQDKNLTATPVDLYYAAIRTGPWTPIARGLRNDGRYRWMPPNEIKAAFVRMVVNDKAGNSSHFVTPQVVELDDGVRVHAHVIGVATQGSSATPPEAH